MCLLQQFSKKRHIVAQESLEECFQEKRKALKEVAEAMTKDEISPYYLMKTFCVTILKKLIDSSTRFNY